VVDIGGGTTDIAVQIKKAIRYTSVLPVGGDHFTRDMAVGLRTPLEDAERIKKEYGTVEVDAVAADEGVAVPGVGTRPSRDIPRRVVAGILRDRAIEVLQLVKGELERSGCREQLTSGVVLTGGGSLLHGMLELAEAVLEMPIRQGLPRGVHGLTDDLSHPVYATAVGLAMYGADRDGEVRPRQGRTSSTPWIFGRFLSWVGN